MKKFAIFTLVMLLLFNIIPASPAVSDAHAASAASKNRKADAAYDKARQSLLKKSSGLSWKYVDLTGDGVHEFFAEYWPKAGGPAQQIIYTYKKGKVKTVMKASVYGMNRIVVYRKTKSMIIHGAGHGGEQYVYYKMKGGKYKRVASRSRQSKNGGGITNGPWYYYNAKNTSVDKGTFSRLIKGIQKGKKTKLNNTKWKTIW